MSHAKSGVLTIAYVLTSDGGDQFADMALVSILSVRISNPGCRIVLLCDSQSYKAIKTAKHRVLEVCDEILSVVTPDGLGNYRNRYVKCRMVNFIQGDFIYLDCDTIVCGPLAGAAAHSQSLGAIPNHNQSNISRQLTGSDHKIIAQLGWDTGLRCFFNGGVLSIRESDDAKLFYEQWAKNYEISYSKTGSLKDQPSLNRSIVETGISVEVLGDEFNAQISSICTSPRFAAVWHFYSSEGLKISCLSHSLKLLQTRGIQSVSRYIQAVCGSGLPTINQDRISRRLWAGRSGAESVWESLWLEGRRWDSIYFLASSLLKRPLLNFRKL